MHDLAYFTHFLITVFGVVALFWLAKKGLLPTLPPERGQAIWPLALAAALAIVFFLVEMRLTVPLERRDFLDAYYPAGQVALENSPEKLKHLLSIGTKGGFVNIPIMAYLLTPFALVPAPVAAFLFTVIGLALTIAAWFMLVRLAHLQNRDRWILALLFLANGALIHGLKWGNLSYYLIAALAGGLLLVRAGRSSAAGLLLGVAAVVKPALALFLLFFLFRRDWKGLLAFAATGIVTALLSLAVFGWDMNLYWFQNCILQYSHTWMALSGVQSIPAYILRLEPEAAMSQWVTVTPTVVQKIIAQALTGLIILSAAAACWRFKPAASGPDAAEAHHRRDLQYCLVICHCLITSPLTWSHYFTWLMVPTAFFLAAQSHLPKLARITGWAGIALITPLIGWTGAYENPLIMTGYRIFYVSHLLFGGILWFGLIAWWLHRSGKGHIIRHAV